MMLRPVLDGIFRTESGEAFGIMPLHHTWRRARLTSALRCKYLKRFFKADNIVDGMSRERQLADAFKREDMDIYLPEGAAQGGGISP